MAYCSIQRQTYATAVNCKKASPDFEKLGSLSAALVFPSLEQLLRDDDRSDVVDSDVQCAEVTALPTWP